MNNYGKLRLAAFLATFLVCALAERLRPRRARAAAAGPRWFANLGLAALGTLAVRLLLPFAAVETAYRAEVLNIGVLNRLPLSFPVKFLLSVLLLDLLIYAQHRFFHWSPALWRLHAVHHTDLDLDASSGVRFHPGELLLSALIKTAGAALIGAHFLAVAFFEVLLNATSLFNHANLDLGPLDRLARFIVVTPDMHRVHHSLRPEELRSNFSFNFPWWDRLFGTYRAVPAEPHETMPLGLADERDPRALTLPALLLRPYKKAA